MSITLNLHHTFDTRVVYSSEEIAAVRETLAESIEIGRKTNLEKLTQKRRGEVKAGLKMFEQITTMNDEDMILFITKQAFKQGVKQEVESALKELNVTSMSPVKTVLLPRCELCILNSTCIKVDRIGCVPVLDKVCCDSPHDACAKCAGKFAL